MRLPGIQGRSHVLPNLHAQARLRNLSSRQGCLLALPVALLVAIESFANNSSNLADLSLEQLSEVRITTVSKQKESLLDAAASVFVITQEEIRRAGVTSIPEALRLAPGVEVARISAHAWAISVRGFNSDITNKLLVLIDGRSVYSPLYAGVFWDTQDTLLEDIDRIEVISGPGGTLWGANAVNGVVNIITRSAQDTLGGYAELGSGNEERGFAGFRYGGQIGEDGALRAYVKAFDRDDSETPTGDSAVDRWHMTQGGFRADWSLNDHDSLTLQGDAYKGREDAMLRPDFEIGGLPGDPYKGTVEISGGNLLGRWTHKDHDGSEAQLQVYYDYTDRDIPGTYSERRDTLDVDFQYGLTLGKTHELLWGLGYRNTRDDIDNTTFSSFMPSKRSDETFSAFIQDKVDLWNSKVFLTVGSKFEENDYTGFEMQPNIRLSWLASDSQTLWASVSRAVRIPARLDTDLQLVIPLGELAPGVPVYVTVDGNDDIDSEELIAYEAGYRIQVTDQASFDLALFFNDYDKIQTAELSAPEIFTTPNLYFVLPNELDNGIRAKSHGGTAVLNLQPTDNWRLRVQYALLELRMDNKPWSNDLDSAREEGNSPRHQAAVHSFFDLSDNISAYLGIRYVDRLDNLENPSYTAVDLRIGWQPIKDVELSVTAQNLFDDTHSEFGPEQSFEVERSVYGKVTCWF